MAIGFTRAHRTPGPVGPDGSARILVAGDKDFGEWIFLRGKSQPPLIRLAAMSPANQVKVLTHIVQTYEGPLQSGALITATTEKVRIRHKEGNREGNS